MKKIYAFFGLSFLLFSASFSFADERHDIIIQHYQETHPENQNFYTLETIESNNNLNNTHLVLTGEELTNNKDYVGTLLQRIPNLHLILNVEENDGLVTNGSLSLELATNPSLPLGIEYLPHNLTIMNLTQDVRMIGNSFLNYNRQLTCLDLSFLNQVTQIGNEFLFACDGLQQLDLPHSNQITQIEAGFLEGCTGLQQLDLSPLSQVTRIRYGFLSTCTGLRTLDLSPLNQVTEIGSMFLYGCSGLTKFNQIILPAHNPALEDALKATFPEGPEDIDIGNMVREVYTDGYVPASSTTKRAQQ